MNQTETTPATHPILPQSIWDTLTAALRATVRQQLIQLCCQLLEQWAQEHGHDAHGTARPPAPQDYAGPSSQAGLYLCPPVLAQTSGSQSRESGLPISAATACSGTGLDGRPHTGD